MRRRKAVLGAVLAIAVGMLRIFASRAQLCQVFGGVRVLLLVVRFHVRSLVDFPGFRYRQCQAS